MRTTVVFVAFFFCFVNSAVWAGGLKFSDFSIAAAIIEPFLDDGKLTVLLIRNHACESCNEAERQRPMAQRKRQR